MTGYVLYYKFEKILFKSSFSKLKTAKICFHKIIPYTKNCMER